MLGDEEDSSSRTATAIPPPPPVPPPQVQQQQHQLPPPPPESQHPTLRRSVSTDDESASTAMDPHASLVQEVIRQSSGDSRFDPTARGDNMAYLLRYETMVRQQEAEDMSVIAHMRPCVNRMLELLCLPKLSNSSDAHTWLTQEVSFAQLKEAVMVLEDLQQDSLQRTENITTDRQLMMVLRLLTQKVTHANTDTTICWAEFIQCYKVCISGMLTLQHLPKDSAVRSRARDRTLAMLSLFEPPSTLLFTDDAMAAAAAGKVEHSETSSTGILDSAPLTAAARGALGILSSSSSPSAFEKMPVDRRRRPLFRRKTKRVLLFGLLVLAVVYMVWTRWMGGFETNDRMHTTNHHLQHGPMMYHPPQQRSAINAAQTPNSLPPIVLLPTPPGDGSKPRIKESVYHGSKPRMIRDATPSTRRKRRGSSNRLHPSEQAPLPPFTTLSEEYSVAMERWTAPVATVAIGGYLVAGAPLAVASLATAGIGKLIQAAVLHERRDDVRV